MKFGAVILAAGLSRRMQKPKLLLPLGNTPIFMRVVETASACGFDPLILVAGEHGEAFASRLASYPDVRIKHNPDFRSGMGTSLKCGIQSLDGDTDAACVFLADQPFVTKDVVLRLLREYEDSYSKGFRIVRAKYLDKPGHPVIFSAELFPGLLKLNGDVGGKKIIREHIERVKYVHFNNPLWGQDIDTPLDYERALAYSSKIDTRDD